MDYALVLLALIALAVVYKLGLFRPIIDLAGVATRESAVYNREHKGKVARRYLDNKKTLSKEDIKQINDNIAAIDSLNFD